MEGTRRGWRKEAHLDVGVYTLGGENGSACGCGMCTEERLDVGMCTEGGRKGVRLDVRCGGAHFERERSGKGGKESECLCSCVRACD